MDKFDIAAIAAAAVIVILSCLFFKESTIGRIGNYIKIKISDIYKRG